MTYVDRSIDALIRELLAELPALMLVGPRAAGKSTTAARQARTCVALDRPAEAAAFRADPDEALGALAEPVLLDEWQEVPEVLGAVKRAVDRDSRPGRFLLTGSVTGDLVAAASAATGRVTRIAMFGLTVRERLGRVGASTPLLDRLANGEAPTLPPDVPALGEYVEMALCGGFPEPALWLGAAARRRWLEGYVEQLLTRDVQQFAQRADPTRLRRYLEACVLNAAGVVADAALATAAGVNVRTAQSYDALLSHLLILDALPAWSSNRFKRLVKGAKRHVTDPSLFVGVLGVDVTAVMRDGDLLGRLLESFVVAQLRAELPMCRTPMRLYHLRTEQGRQEVDVLVEVGARDIIAIEVKAAAAPGAEAARHLAWLRDQLGERFRLGVVLHTGPRIHGLGPRILAVPIAALWG